MLEDRSIGRYWRDQAPNKHRKRRRPRNVWLRVRDYQLSCRIAVEHLLKHESPLSDLRVLRERRGVARRSVQIKRYLIVGKPARVERNQRQPNYTKSKPLACMRSVPVSNLFICLTCINLICLEGCNMARIVSWLLFDAVSLAVLPRLSFWCSSAPAVRSTRTTSS